MALREHCTIRFLGCCQLKTIISCDEDWFLLIPNLCASVCLESVCLYAVHTLNTALTCVVLCSQCLTRTFAVFRLRIKKERGKKKGSYKLFLVALLLSAITGTSTRADSVSECWSSLRVIRPLDRKNMAERTDIRGK